MELQSAELDQSALRVLVIEDNRDFAENMAEILATEGGQVRTVGTATEGRRVLAEFGPDICFIDLRLPDDSGETLVAELSRTAPEILCIVLTGNATIHSAVAAVNAGAFGFLLKDMPVDGILASFRRAAERIQLERQKRNLEALLRHREQLAMIGQMSATLAHEIKNPLTGISQALEILLDAVGEPPEMKGLKNSILQRFRNLNDLVEDLLEFSKPLNVRRRPVELSGLVDSVLAELRSENRLREVELKVAIAPEADRLRVDDVHFRILLRNLFRNADQAMEKSELRELRVRARREQVVTILEIEDTGPGIPDELRDKIFEPFYTTKTRGTGLGLALATRIVDEHGGAVSARNIKGAGARFTLVLPD
ncbi:MAG: response regulator [Planctomycetes bacterium]|nr:response regulator [Planctomycetota bacterium]